MMLFKFIGTLNSEKYCLSHDPRIVIVEHANKQASENERVSTCCYFWRLDPCHFEVGIYDCESFNETICRGGWLLAILVVFID